eukprot:CAMPEP_0198205700 /NCGR_PEP_ID=MMETSP1445-20131203/9236_1 /TAXON_ID=36898 /ORGANISM="Pyramimonas sp., Strain CCMP2087" /LENGTH=94 /DNA_ID=CAMNT_0043878097 /DNA_START=19 /DNA_END=300 /DNA_ORIENTATION=-
MAENPVSEPCTLSAVNSEKQAAEQGSEQISPGVSRRDFDTCCKVLEALQQNKEAFEVPKMRSSWTHLPPDVAGEVMAHLKWDGGASAVFRKICK